MVGWVGGWSEDWRVMLNSTQDQVDVEVRVELGKNRFPVFPLVKSDPISPNSDLNQTSF